MPVGLDIERQLLLAQRAYPIRSRFRANHLASAIECETDDNYSGRAFQLVNPKRTSAAYLFRMLGS